MVDQVIEDYYASTTQHYAGGILSKTNSSGSSHSADNLSPGVLWCENCPEDAKRVVPANSESKNWNLCRQCWRDKGSPFFNACCYKCSEEGCPNVSYKTRGAAYHLRICQSCYKKTAKVSGSSHSADDRSADVLLCENCQRMPIGSRLGMRGHFKGFAFLEFQFARVAKFWLDY